MLTKILCGNRDRSLISSIEINVESLMKTSYTCRFFTSQIEGEDFKMMVLRDYWELEVVLETRDSGRYLLQATATAGQGDSTRNSYPTGSLPSLFLHVTVTLFRKLCAAGSRILHFGLG